MNKTFIISFALSALAFLSGCQNKSDHSAPYSVMQGYAFNIGPRGFNLEPHMCNKRNTIYRRPRLRLTNNSDMVIVRNTQNQLLRVYYTMPPIGPRRVQKIVKVDTDQIIYANFCLLCFAQCMPRCY